MVREVRFGSLTGGTIGWRQILFPKRLTIFGVVGSVIGLFGDLTKIPHNPSFIAAFVLALILCIIAGAYICYHHAHLKVTLAFSVPGPAPDQKDVHKEAVSCWACDLFRSAIVALLIFALTCLVAPQQSLSAELLPDKLLQALGLLQKDLAAVKADTTAIRSDTRQILSTVQGDIPSEATADDAENFRNAQRHVYQPGGNVETATMLIEAIYAHGGINKLDVAELYQEALSRLKGPTSARTQLLALAQSNRDASLLLVAARKASGAEDAQRLREIARSFDPAHPLLAFDPLDSNAAMLQSGGTMAQMQAKALKEKQQIETFLRALDTSPMAHYYLVPQSMPDFAALAMQRRQMADMRLATFGSAEAQVKAAQARMAEMQDHYHRLHEKAQQARRAER